MGLLYLLLPTMLSLLNELNSSTQFFWVNTTIATMPEQNTKWENQFSSMESLFSYTRLNKNCPQK